MSPMCKRRKDKISKYERLINIDNIDDNGFENWASQYSTLADRSAHGIRKNSKKLSKKRQTLAICWYEYGDVSNTRSVFLVDIVMKQTVFQFFQAAVFHALYGGHSSRPVAYKPVPQLPES